MTAIASENVKAEARRARNRGNLLQVFVEPCTPPLFFGERQGIDLANWDGSINDARFAALVAGIKAIATGDRPPQSVGYLPTGTSSQAWARIKDSFDTRDYDDFVSVFPNSAETFDARRQKRQLEDWGNANREDTSALKAFLAQPLFDVLRLEVDKGLLELERAKQAEKDRRQRKSDDRAAELEAARHAASNGGEEAIYRLVQLLRRRGRPERHEALVLALGLAEAGHPDAQNLLAEMLTPTFPSDRVEVNADEQRRLQLGRSNDRDAAAEWRRRAARRGQKDAQRRLERTRLENEMRRMEASKRAEKSGFPTRWRVLPLTIMADLPFAILFASALVPALLGFLPIARDGFLGVPLVVATRLLIDAGDFGLWGTSLSSTELALAALLAGPAYVFAGVAVYVRLDGAEFRRSLMGAGIAWALGWVSAVALLAIAYLLPNSMSPWILGVASALALLTSVLWLWVVFGARTDNEYDALVNQGARARIAAFGGCLALALCIIAIQA
jgi:TPR repeat protein